MFPNCTSPVHCLPNCQTQGQSRGYIRNDSDQKIYLRLNGPDDSQPDWWDIEPGNTCSKALNGQGEFKLSTAYISTPGPRVSHVVWTYSNQPGLPVRSSIDQVGGQTFPNLRVMLEGTDCAYAVVWQDGIKPTTKIPAVIACNANSELKVTVGPITFNRHRKPA
jgi:hypothetical protein